MWINLGRGIWSKNLGSQGYGNGYSVKVTTYNDGRVVVVDEIKANANFPRIEIQITYFEVSSGRQLTLFKTVIER